MLNIHLPIQQHNFCRCYAELAGELTGSLPFWDVPPNIRRVFQLVLVAELDLIFGGAFDLIGIMDWEAVLNHLRVKVLSVNANGAKAFMHRLNSRKSNAPGGNLNLVCARLFGLNHVFAAGE